MNSIITGLGTSRSLQGTFNLWVFGAHVEPFRVWGSLGCKVSGLGSRVWGFGFTV